MGDTMGDKDLFKVYKLKKLLGARFSDFKLDLQEIITETYVEGMRHGESNERINQEYEKKTQ